jgi:hypothetical protein
MTLMAASRMAVSRRSVIAFQQQRRGFIDYLVNYPDHVRFFVRGAVLQRNVESLYCVSILSKLRLFHSAHLYLYYILGPPKEGDSMQGRNSIGRSESDLVEATG